MGLVGDVADRSIADVPDDAPVVAHSRVTQCCFLNFAEDGTPKFDGVADTKLIFKDHRNTCEVIGDVRLCAEPDHGADNSTAGNDRGEVDPERGQDRDDCCQPDRDCQRIFCQ